MYDEVRLKQIEHCLGYFDPQVLAAYKNEPDKYQITENDSEGELRNITGEPIHIRFGFRILENGICALVIWKPDLYQKSTFHVQQWKGFKLENPIWTTSHDKNFDIWVQQNLEGLWVDQVDPVTDLSNIMKVINALTCEVVGSLLYKDELDQTLGYPAAENTHRYQDSHKTLYGYLIDGLNKTCISSIVSKLNKQINVSNEKTVSAIKKLFPELENSSCFSSAMDVISEQRRLASHKVRPPTEPCDARSKFTHDLTLCVKGIKELLEKLEKSFGITGENAEERHKAKKWLATIGQPPEDHYSIMKALQMKGKTIQKVEAGLRTEHENLPKSEALVIYFTDGSIMSLDTGSNVSALVSDENGLHPQDLHIDFCINWVPGLPKIITPPKHEIHNPLS
jgi:hypothetical protein